MGPLGIPGLLRLLKLPLKFISRGLLDDLGGHPTGGGTVQGDDCRGTHALKHMAAIQEMHLLGSFVICLCTTVNGASQ